MRVLPTSWCTRLVTAILLASVPGVAVRGESPVVAGTAAADEAAELADPVPAQDRPPGSGTREQAYAEFRRLFDAGEYEAAVEPARQVLELTERDQPVAPDELQVALMNLAVAQRHAGDYVGAEESYLRVIELIEGSGRRTSRRLVRAYAGLAATYYDARRYDLAVDSFERAVALHRRSEGLFDAAQLPLLAKYVDALTELGRHEEALAARGYALNVIGRRHGQRSLPFALELESLGRWYSRIGAYEASRLVLKKADDLVGSLPDAGLAERVGPLTGLAENARRWLSDPQLREASADDARRAIFGDPTLPAPPGLSLSTIAAEGLRALEEAVEVVEKAPDAPPSLAASVRVQLGDWHQAREAEELALASYRIAWQVAGRAADAGALREELFGAPLLVYYLVPDHWNRYAQRPRDEVELRHVEVELTVTAGGGIRDPQPVADADERLLSQTLRAAETARYRPRFVDGEPVETTGVRFVQPFFVLREDDAPAEPATTPPAPSPQGSG